MDTYAVVVTGDTRDTQITTARRLTTEEKAEYAEWYREIGFVGLGEPEYLRNVTQMDVFGMFDRRCDGSFCGSNNQAWIITPEQAATLRQLEADKAAAKQARHERERQASREYDARVAKHICPHCHTFCDGDCQA
jgi:hypothetical protein